MECEWYKVISDYTATDNTQLSVCCGDTVIVNDTSNSTDWWWVESINGQLGCLPANHLSTEPLSFNERWDNEEYYGCYGDLKIHREMLNDVPRNRAYCTAIMDAEQYINGKVYAVEKSDIALKSCDIIKHNGFDHVIEIIQSDVTEIVLPVKVDLIISEWMGTLLLFEFMIESVIKARDLYLKPEGIIWPSTAQLYLVPCTANEKYMEHIGIWSDVYGFDFSIISSNNDIASRPLHNHVLSNNDMLSNPSLIYKINMNTVSVKDIEQFESTLIYTIIKTGLLHGFCSWFDVSFGGLANNPQILSTSPYQLLTHWKQDLLLIKEPLSLMKGDVIKGNITMNRHKVWRRHMTFQLTFSVLRNDNVIYPEMKQVYKIWR